MFFVNLAPISDPDSGGADHRPDLEVKEVAGQPLFDLVKTFLREKQVLLLLDNFEQALFRELGDRQDRAFPSLAGGDHVLDRKAGGVHARS